jgi:hypothetical protein
VELNKYSICVFVECLCFSYFEFPMRMPLLSYFLVIGTTLLCLLLWSSKELPPSPSPIKTSQQVGLPKLEAPHEPLIPLMTTANFAKEEEHPAKPENTVATPETVTEEKHARREKGSRTAHERKTESKRWNRLTQNRFVVYPYNFSIRR